MARRAVGRPVESSDRRRFLRQSAEVAAAGLFAGTALETVVERVLQRVGETRMMEELAGEVAKNLRDVRLHPRAVAEGCCGP